ncbi:MAG: hypothetical protein ABI203_00430 [Mucilaginibacter sp.]
MNFRIIPVDSFGRELKSLTKKYPSLKQEYAGLLDELESNSTLGMPIANKWPAALKQRIENGTAQLIHIPFKKEPIHHATATFSHNNPPKGGALGIYSLDSYKGWGIPY